MEVVYTYQQDTVKVNNQLKLLPDLEKAEGLKLQRSIISLESALIRDTARRQVEIELPPQPPTLAQIRYWRWRNEQNMLVDTSRYILPKNNVKLISTVAVDEKGLGLPIYNKTSLNTDWVTILLLLILVLFATVRNTYSKYLGHLFQSMVNYSTAFRMFREKNNSVLHGEFRLEVYFYLTGSLFLFQVINHFQINLLYSNITLFMICLGSVLSYFLFKKLVYHMLGSLLESTNETGEYLFNMDNFNRITGLFLFPTISFIAFYPFKNPMFPVVVGILTVLVIYLFLLQRGITILMKKQLSKFYLFLYLCTLEFLPLLLIYKIIMA